MPDPQRYAPSNNQSHNSSRLIVPLHLAIHKHDDKTPEDKQHSSIQGQEFAVAIPAAGRAARRTLGFRIRCAIATWQQRRGFGFVVRNNVIFVNSTRDYALERTTRRRDTADIVV
jgi:hypothetical protein